MNVKHPYPIHRRRFLADAGMGFTGMVLGAMLFEDGIAKAGNSPTPKNARAKSVIWLFMLGGASHMETLDPKPALMRYGGKTISESPYASVIAAPQITKNFRRFAGAAKLDTKIFPPQVSFKKYGQCGTEVCDWLPHLGGCVDDIAVIRSLWTTDFSHSAQMLFHTGRILIDGREPCIGSWVHYGLGTLNRQLPKFVVLGRPPSDFGGGYASHQASYLGPEHDGVPIEAEPDRAVPFPPRGAEHSREAQARNSTWCISSIDRPPWSTRRILRFRHASSRMRWRSGCRPPCRVSWTCMARRPRRSNCTAWTIR